MGLKHQVRVDSIVWSVMEEVWGGAYYLSFSAQCKEHSRRLKEMEDGRRSL